MWIVVHMAKSEKGAMEIEDMLKREGFMVKHRAVYRNVPSSENYYEILVLGAEAEEARQVLMENGI